MPKSSTRPDRRRAFFASTAWLVGPLLPMNSVLARVLIDDPQIDALAEHLVSGRHSARERAVVLHDFVRDEIRFGFTPHFYAMSAADVLAARIGYGHTKATLFIALLRAAGIEARQQFVDLDAAVWRGLRRPAHAFRRSQLHRGAARWRLDPDRQLRRRHAALPGRAGGLAGAQGGLWIRHRRDRARRLGRAQLLRSFNFPPTARP